MSSLIVTVTTIGMVRKHSNADRLEIAEVKGWQTVVPKGEFVDGDKVVYFPPDTILPEEVSDELGVTQYLSKGRVHRVKLRGEPSFGLVIRAPEGVELDQDMADKYGATKYVPPLKICTGDQAQDHPEFLEYTEIENMRNFPDTLVDGECVVVTEKIHGANCRVGIIDGEVMAGQHTRRIVRPETEDGMRAHLAWLPYTIPGVVAMLRDYGEMSDVHQVILFGEVYGSVQSLKYGVKGIEFRAFDLMVDSRYVDHAEFERIMTRYEIPAVPVIAIGAFSLEKIKKLSEGTTHVNDARHTREGVVVKPIRERIDPKIDRVILKYVSDTYLFGDHSDLSDK